MKKNLTGFTKGPKSAGYSQTVTVQMTYSEAWAVLHVLAKGNDAIARDETSKEERKLIIETTWVANRLLEKLNAINAAWLK